MQKWSEEKIARWIREGRGQGEGAQYRPWLTVHDLSSRGRCHRPWSAKIGRHLELFSDIEYGVFLIAERSSRVIDIHEQYPLDRELSQAAAHTLGIRHPTYPGTHVPVVLTVDLLVTLRDPKGRVKLGIDCKVKSDAENRRTLEKLALTRACLARCGHRHVLFFDTQLPRQLIRNLESIRGARPHEKELFPYPNYLEEAVDKLYGHFSKLLFGRKPLRVVCQEFDLSAGLRPGTALRAARLLIDRHMLQVDLNQGDLHELPMEAFSMSPQAVAACQGGVP
jgi:hypothetical protein